MPAEEKKPLRTTWIVSTNKIRELGLEGKLLSGSEGLVLKGGEWKCKQKSKKRKCEWKD